MVEDKKYPVCSTCKREMKIVNACVCGVLPKEPCYYCHLQKHHIVRTLPKK